MKRALTLTVLFISIFSSMAIAQEKPIILFPEGAPGEKEQMTELQENTGNKVAGGVVTGITNISAPTITIYNASEELASGSAVIVCPGGAYNLLAYDLEGDEICLWLNDLGITAILLKYRVPRREGREKHEAPLEDLQRAISYIRTHSDSLNIRPNSIGVMGFSAGAHLAVMASTSYDHRTYPLKEVDKAGCKPNFALLVYPAYLSGENFQVAPEIKVSKTTPPTMIIHSEDDTPYINSSLFYYYALKEVGAPVWMNLYRKGGHGYGLRDTGMMISSWPDRAEDWLRELGMIL